jgi:hypothetical protein
VPNETNRKAPNRIVRPCEWQLFSAVNALETQMGSVEAYNRLCDAAEAMKKKIDAGDGRAQHPMWATDPTMIYPA